MDEGEFKKRKRSDEEDDHDVDEEDLDLIEENIGIKVWPLILAENFVH